MPRITAEEMKTRRREFLDEAGRAFDPMLGSDGQNGLVTFEEREERACELGDGLSRRLLEDYLSGWEQILDFLHLLVHLFAAARLAHARDAKAAWKLYERIGAGDGW